LKGVVTVLIIIVWVVSVNYPNIKRL